MPCALIAFYFRVFLTAIKPAVAIAKAAITAMVAGNSGVAGEVVGCWVAVAWASIVMV